jgi:hypothetical protein
LDQSAIHITRWGNFSAQRALADRGWQLVVPALAAESSSTA